MDIKVINPIPQEDIDNILYHYNNGFEHLEQIGMGYSAQVFRYKNYAIKAYEDEGFRDGEILENFQDNPLFPKLYFYNDDKLMVTEYLDIINAYDYFERNVNIGISALEIFDYCYKKGYIPCDIHDDNVVITNKDELKIIDVGSFQKWYGPEHYTIHNILMTKVHHRNDYIELDNIIEHVKRPPIAI
jgi:serine/threonine protein kinase